MPKLKLISGTSNIPLAEEVAKQLNIPLTPVEIKQFSDGEIYVRVLESVRGCDIFVIQPTNGDVNNNLMELAILVDALKRSSPASITAVIPYYGYARQDKKTQAREPITAKLVANILQVAGVQRVITFELHVPQVQGFFDIPSDNLDLLPLFAHHVIDKNLKDMVVVSPDAGGAARARKFAEIISAPIAIVDKRRRQHNVAEVNNVIGEVKGKSCILIDDMIDTAGSITAAADLLKKFGATQVVVLATHGVLSGPAYERLNKSVIEEVVISNTILPDSTKQCDKLTIISIAELLAQDIQRTHQGTSMGEYYRYLYDELAKKMETK